MSSEIKNLSRSATTSTFETTKKKIVCPMDSNFKSLKEKIFRQMDPKVRRKCRSKERKQMNISAYNSIKNEIKDMQTN